MKRVIAVFLIFCLAAEAGWSSSSQSPILASALSSHPTAAWPYRPAAAIDRTVKVLGGFSPALIRKPAIAVSFGIAAALALFILDWRIAWMALIPALAAVALQGGTGDRQNDGPPVATRWGESKSCRQADRVARALGLEPALGHLESIRSDGRNVHVGFWSFPDRTDAMMRIGWLIYIDQKAYEALPVKLKADLGFNLIIVPNLADSMLSSAKALYPHTLATIASMMHVRWKGKRMIDAGSGDGMLAIAAARLGARDLFLVEVDAGKVDQTHYNLEINGIAGWARVLHANLAEPAEFLEVYYRLPKYPAVLVCNIGFWPAYDVSNQNIIRFVPAFGNIVEMIMEGYRLEIQAILEDGTLDLNARREHAGVIRGHMRIAEGYGFKINPYLYYWPDQERLTAVSWTATRMKDETESLRSRLPVPHLLRFSA